MKPKNKTSLYWQLHEIISALWAKLIQPYFVQNGQVSKLTLQKSTFEPMTHKERLFVVIKPFGLFFSTPLIFVPYLFFGAAIQLWLLVALFFALRGTKKVYI